MGNSILQVMLYHVHITIGVLFSLPSGDYATYINWKGATAWTKNLGYQPNDKVEIYHTRSGKPEKIIINGKNSPLP